MSKVGQSQVIGGRFLAKLGQVYQFSFVSVRKGLPVAAGTSKFASVFYASSRFRFDALESGEVPCCRTEQEEESELLS